MAVPYLQKEQVEQYANNVLATYWQNATVPIDVEHIVEIEMGMEIRPVIAARERFGFEGALTSDLETILVDADQQRNPNHYRFTVAHELGHKEIHSQFIQSLGFTTAEEWQAAVKQISPADYGKLEAQAYIFAGYLLVPTGPLRNICDTAREVARAKGIDLDSMGDTAISYVAGNIAKQFKVSTDIIQRRLQAEEIFG